jgi:anaerobic ribonucleoside-triphosphate reductase activating protein
MQELYLNNIVRKTSVLGKGKRYAIWVQGCKQKCKNCFAPETQPINKNGYFISIEEIIKDIMSEKSLSGLTITGGEPFLQAKNLSVLIKHLKQINPALDYIVYSGYTYEKLVNSNNRNIHNLLDLIDLLIDGNYEDHLNNNEPLIGSANQSVNILTNKGEILANYMKLLHQREIEFYITNENLTFTIVGIPPKKQNQLLNKFEQILLKEQIK